jgi:hypothetical protein
MRESDDTWAELGAKVEDILVGAHVSELVFLVIQAIVVTVPFVRGWGWSQPT